MALGQMLSGRKLGVHSIDHYELDVPCLKTAKKFYTDFGLDVEEAHEYLALRTFSSQHVWSYLYPSDKKRLRKIVFGAYAEDLQALNARVEQSGQMTTLFQNAFGKDGFKFIDPDGVNVEVIVSQKVTPNEKDIDAKQTQVSGQRGAAFRRNAAKVQPTRLSHILLFTSDIERSIQFYETALGLKLSDYSKDAVAFLHAVHGADHHTIAFAQSSAKGFHHCSWDVVSVEEVGLGAKHMMDQGWTQGWGLGRHVLGSNYFYYVRDPWGSYSEYSYDIDFIPADLNWQAEVHPAEDSLYLWGPEVPDEFVTNFEA
ncbi:VOC family protein [Acinetobacter sichuanensis]|uniref:VOC family protein n=1 Tax=Acinetobacter sichuanensis TaxID=2136183 RepID=UPI00280E004F|nr:VOC family protein [Acinetobacter sichuanensis]MDQ9021219.1 VOC family protein [Acinetobacter sichuanensis]